MIKELFILLLGAGCVAFTIATIAGLVNFLFDLDMKMEGESVPKDPPAIILFAVIAVFCGGLMFFLTRNRK